MSRVPELHASIASLLFHATCTVHLHFATDTDTEALLADRLPALLASPGSKHQVRCNDSGTFTQLNISIQCPVLQIV